VLWGEHAIETQLLRSLRDGVLNRHALGRALTRAYYRVAPAVAAWLAGHPRAHGLAKGVLMPVVAVARYLSRSAR
jgi:hypothetical protein